jgi:hypothetical protein
VYDAHVTDHHHVLTVTLSKQEGSINQNLLPCLCFASYACVVASEGSNRMHVVHLISMS